MLWLIRAWSHEWVHTQDAHRPSEALRSGSEKGSFGKGVFVKMSISRDSRERRDSRDPPEIPWRVKHKGASDYFLEMMEITEILEILKIPQVKRLFCT